MAVRLVVRLQDGPIGIEALLEEVRSDADGAVALFVGTVRDHSAGRRVLHLEYEAYREMAEPEMRRIAEEVAHATGVRTIALVHRIGRLEIGQASIAVAVASAHRAAALDACRATIDAVKLRAPIWKKEFFEGGAVWIEGAGDFRTG